MTSDTTISSRAQRRAEIDAVMAEYLAFRDAMDHGRGDWADFARFFSDDATYIDPAWGRVDGIDAISEFLMESMAGITGWTFPVDWYAVEGDHVVVKWRQVLPGQRADGSRYENSGISTLHYAGNGTFDFQEDQLNMLHVREVIRESGWTPGEGFNVPPTHPRRL